MLARSLLAAVLAGALALGGAPASSQAVDASRSETPIVALADSLRSAVRATCVCWGAPPAWATWHARSYAIDLTGDGALDRLVVGAAHACLVVDGVQAFQTPADWWVSDAHVGDLDGDGLPEVVFLAWRSANYGSSRPFWEEVPGNEGFSQHVFVYGWRDGALQPLWMSSQIGAAVESLALAEGGAVILTERDGSVTAWVWEGWGLKRAADPVQPQARLTLLVVGDVIAHTPVYEGAYDPASRSFVFDPVFAPVADLIAAADYAVVGQETPFVSDPALRSGYPRFATPATLGEALVHAGFDGVLAASNHVLDIGERGVRDTLAFWEDHPEVTVLGLHAAQEDVPGFEVRTVKGVRLGLLNATYGTNGYELAADAPYTVDLIGDGEALVEAVAQARDASDCVVCFLHMGEEYESLPTAEQRALVERLVDAGAGLVVCSHSHVVGPWERLVTAAGNRAVVCWGLGNFVAVQDRLDCILGVAARIVLEQAPDGTVRIADVELVPTVCHTARSGEVAVYPLTDYTDGLAAEHYLNDLGHAVTVAGLWALYGNRAVEEQA